ncbi:MAG: universal stress protein [Myxococcales bacterium]|nr:universal stress protein [Myxococcales bacterium]
MRHILAASDLSSPSDLALDRAIGLARHTGAKLTIATIEEPHDNSAIALDISAATMGDFEAHLAEYTETQLAERVERAVAAGVEVTSVRKRGRASDEICELAEGLDVDLVVVGSAGRTGVKRLVLGSVAEKVAHSAPRPVLIARGRTSGPFTRVLVATDFAPPAARALEVARALATAEADVEAVYAWHYPAGSMGLAALGERTHAMAALREALTQGPQTRGDELVAAETAAGRRLRFSLRQGPPVEVVVEEATTFGVDLVAIGTYGAGGVRRLLLGSVAGQIMRHAPCSVLVTHA